MVTQKDIAARVGCNVSTISRVINGETQRVAEETCRKIRDAARELGYVRNESARTLVSGRSCNVGVILQDSGSRLSQRLSGAIRDCFSRYGFMAICGFSESDETRERNLLECFLARRVDALIIGRLSPCANADLIDHYRDFGIPVIGIGLPREVAFNEPRVIELIVEKLDDGRRKNVAYLRYRNRMVSSGIERGARLRETLKRYDGLSFQEEWTAAGFDDCLQIAEAVRASRYRPNVLVAYNDYLADQQIKAFAIAGIRVPKDLEVIAIDGCGELFMMMSVATVRLPVDTLAEEIWKIFRHGPSEQGTVLVEPEFIPGDSMHSPCNKRIIS